VVVQLFLLSYGVGQQYSFEIFPVLDTLPADGEAVTTLVATLVDEDGTPIDGQELLFSIEAGDAYFGGASRRDLVTDAEDEGGGVYAATLTAGTEAGEVSVAALWVGAPQDTVPEVTANIELVDARVVTLAADDLDVAEHGAEVSIFAFVLDELGRPIEDADLEFDIVQGDGKIRQRARGGELARYATVFEVTEPGLVEIEVVDTGFPQARESITLDVLRASTVEAFAFPEQIERRSRGRVPAAENTAAIVVILRNGEGELLRGLEDGDLIAEVVSGPGSVGEFEEIALSSRRGAGVYVFSFTSSEEEGETEVRILQPGSGVETTIMVDTVGSLEVGNLEEASLKLFSDEPLRAGDDALLLALAQDASGNPVRRLRSDFVLEEEYGEFPSLPSELRLRPARSTGLYFVPVSTAFLPEVSTQAEVIFLDRGDAAVAGSLSVDLADFPPPEITVFPERISSVGAAAVDFRSEAPVADTRAAPRFELVTSAPLIVGGGVDNDGRPPDLIVGDRVSSGLVEIAEGSGVVDEQTITVVVHDTWSAQQDSYELELVVGEQFEIDASSVGGANRRGDVVQIIAFVRDHFGRPALEHELILNVVEGYGRVLADSTMIDDGGRLEGLKDPIRNDGMYVGAVEVLAPGPLTVRITDFTVPSLPSTVVDIAGE
jgi:adhesin/invasin